MKREKSERRGKVAGKGDGAYLPVKLLVNVR